MRLTRSRLSATSVAKPSIPEALHVPGNPPGRDLSARERQITDALYRRGRATVAELRQDLPDPPTSSAIRTMLQRLEAKGHIMHRQEGRRNVYLPTVPRDRARELALDRLVSTFFEDSPVAAAAALLDRSTGELSAEELERLDELIERARRRGR